MSAAPTFRDARPGDFYLDPSRFPIGGGQPDTQPAFIRFARHEGVGVDLWSGMGLTAKQALQEGKLDWTVDQRDIFTPSEGFDFAPMRIPGYRALVRPDTGHVMSVVKTSYSVVENEWVAEALVALGQRFDPEAGLIAATSFGREQDRSLFACRVTVEDGHAILLVAYNSHGGEGAVRFRILEAEEGLAAVLAVESNSSSFTVGHHGNAKEHLEERAYGSVLGDIVTRYVEETAPVWEQMRSTRWDERLTDGLLRHVWGTPPDLHARLPSGMPKETQERDLRHPYRHVSAVLREATDAATAFKLICGWLDNESEACERGDFTKDRDERLALGAGTAVKERIWRWIVGNTKIQVR